MGVGVGVSVSSFSCMHDVHILPAFRRSLGMIYVRLKSTKQQNSAWKSCKRVRVREPFTHVHV